MAVYRQAGGHRSILFLMELTHRSLAIKLKMEQRAMYRRRRRSKNLRYRAPRWHNRTKPKGWLAPSLWSRVQHIDTWARRLSAWCPIEAVDLELVRFDTHLMANPDVSGVGYQHGTLHGYEVREYVLEKWGRRCLYCDAENVPLNLDHVVPRSLGGSDRPSNLVPSCIPCNQAERQRSCDRLKPRYVTPRR
jgi:5-methylcytosine-specific restriction endonuclease McrA